MSAIICRTAPTRSADHHGKGILIVVIRHQLSREPTEQMLLRMFKTAPGVNGGGVGPAVLGSLHCEKRKP
jgi:hypothetical protein